jgi:hypothetical protein
VLNLLSTGRKITRPALHASLLGMLDELSGTKRRPRNHESSDEWYLELKC